MGSDFGIGLSYAEIILLTWYVAKWVDNKKGVDNKKKNWHSN
jgi:hypothetical protein